MRTIRKKALIHDTVISLVIGFLISIALNLDGWVWTALGGIEFSCGAFFWVVAFDPVLQIKKKGGFIDDAEVDKRTV